MALVLASGVLAGCGRSDVQVYKVAKEPAQVSPAAMPPGHPDASAAASAPALKYKAPQGWQEVAPGELRAASCRMEGQSGKHQQGRQRLEARPPRRPVDRQPLKRGEQQGLPHLAAQHKPTGRREGQEQQQIIGTAEVHGLDMRF